MLNGKCSLEYTNLIMKNLVTNYYEKNDKIILKYFK